METKNPLSHTHARTLSDPAVDLVLDGHAVHWVLSVALYTGEKELAGQLAQAEEATPENVPALHALHVMSFDAPVTGEDVPDGHWTHASRSADENVPVGQRFTTSSSCVMD